jgi:hypothetical protein
MGFLCCFRRDVRPSRTLLLTSQATHLAPSLTLNKDSRTPSLLRIDPKSLPYRPSQPRRRLTWTSSTFKTIAPSTIETTTPSASPLFTLPLELRLPIYEELFCGKIFNLGAVWTTREEKLNLSYCLCMGPLIFPDAWDMCFHQQSYYGRVNGLCRPHPGVNCSILKTCRQA